MPKHGKKYRESREAVDPTKTYTAEEAVALVKSTSRSQFDETIEAAFRLGIDPRQADQAVRGTVSLPNGTGKEVRVAVFAAGEKAREATEAGADIVGGQELADEIEGGRTLDFDVTIATPDMMASVGKLGKILGPRGLMPNPKAGTVTMDVGKAVQDFKAGKIEYRNDRSGNVHGVIGKASFNEEALLANLAALTDEIVRARPAAAKGRFVRNLSISSTMGPGIRIDPAEIDLLVASTR